MKTREERHEDLWGGLQETQAPSFCDYAAQFASWAEFLITGVEKSRDVIEVNQAKILLIDKYMSYREYVPKSHRYRVTPNSTHLCIWQIFETYYCRLRIVELSLTPPPLWIPPAPALPPPPKDRQVGIFIGEVP
jgi:hypothetical protein